MVTILYYARIRKEGINTERKRNKKETRINEGGKVDSGLFFNIINIKKKESRFSYRHMKKKKIFEKVLSAFTSNTIQGKCDKSVMKS